MKVYELRFPELGEGLHEGRIDKWLIKPGDEVKEDDGIAEVENDKAMVELPSPVDGKLVEFKVPEGSTVTVGELIAVFEIQGTDQASDIPAGASAVSAQAGVHARSEAITEPVNLQSDSQSSAEVLAVPAVDVLATPGVRKFAREQGVLINQVIGTGANGKVTREDVTVFQTRGSAAAVATDVAQVAPTAVSVAPATIVKEPVSVAQGAGVEGEERVPLSSVRKLIAQAMVKSKYTAPHVTLMDEVDVTELIQLRAEIKPFAAQRGVKITYLPFIVKALVAAVRQFPQLNASFDDERQELVLKKYYHIGIATDTERGLLVPVIRDADRKSMWSIAESIEDLALRGRSGKLALNEMKGSTISISNIGSAGGMFFTPIINYPEVAILGVGRITERPIMKDGQVVGGQMMALSLSFDHRIIDGALGQNFMNQIKKLLGNPRLLLLEV